MISHEYYLITLLINAIRLGEITPDQTVEVLEKVLLIMDGCNLSEEEETEINKLLRGDN